MLPLCRSIPAIVQAAQSSAAEGCAAQPHLEGLQSAAMAAAASRCLGTICCSGHLRVLQKRRCKQYEVKLPPPHWLLLIPAAPSESC